MHVEQLSRYLKGKYVCHEVFERMGILCSYRDWGVELMVMLMNALVQEGLVQKSMGVVEDDFTAQHREKTITNHLMGGRGAWIEAVGRLSEKVHDTLFDQVESDCYQLIAEHDCSAMANLGRVGLTRGTLQLELLRG